MWTGPCNYFEYMWEAKNLLNSFDIETNIRDVFHRIVESWRGAPVSFSSSLKEMLLGPDRKWMATAGVRTRWSLRSLSIQAIMWFYDCDADVSIQNKTVVCPSSLLVSYGVFWSNLILLSQSKQIKLTPISFAVSSFVVTKYYLSSSWPTVLVMIWLKFDLSLESICSKNVINVEWDTVFLNKVLIWVLIFFFFSHSTS